METVIATSYGRGGIRILTSVSRKLNVVVSRKTLYTGSFSGSRVFTSLKGKYLSITAESIRKKKEEERKNKD